MPVERRRETTASAKVGRGGPSRNIAGDAMDPGAGMHRTAGDVEPAQRRATAAELDRGPEEEHLVDLHAAAGEVAVAERRVLRLDPSRGAHRPGEDQCLEARGKVLDPALDQARDLLLGEVGIAGNP